MLTNFENKSLTTKAAPAAPPDCGALRARVDSLRADEIRQEKELHESQAALQVAVSEIQVVSYSVDNNREKLTSAVLNQSSAQTRIIAAAEKLSATRSLLQRAVESLREAEAQIAARDAAELEAEIVTALGDFAADMVKYSQRCVHLQTLREKAQANHHLLTPAVLEAIGPNWGEIHSAGAVESRLQLIGKCAPLPEEIALRLAAAARERARAMKTEAERGEKYAAAQRQRAEKQLWKGTPFTMSLEDGRIVRRELQYGE